MRAPEVYQGYRCTRKSQVWASAATVLWWMKPSLFGLSDAPCGRDLDLVPNPFCIAKLRRLFPAWTGPPVPGDIRLKSQWALSDDYLEDPISGIQNLNCLEEEIRRMGLRQELKDMFLFLFVTNPDERPSASQVLASKELNALRGAVIG